MKKPKKTQKPTLKLGNVYAIHWLDHFNADRIPPDSPLLDAPVTVVSIGRLTALYSNHIILEYSTNLDSSPVVTSVHGIITGCITRITDLGPLEP